MFTKQMVNAKCTYTLQTWDIYTPITNTYNRTRAINGQWGLMEINGD